MLLNCKSDRELDSQHIFYTPTENTVKMPFYIYECGYYNCGEKFRMVHENRDHYLLIATISGVGILIYDGYTYRLPTGSAILVDSRKHMEYYTTGSKNWQMYWCQLNGETIGQYEQYFNEKEISVLCLKETGQLQSFLQELCEHAGNVSASNDFAISNDISNILTIMTVQKKVQLRNGFKPRQVEMVDLCTSYMEEHFQEKVSLEDISNMLDVSKYYLIRIYKDINKITPYEYLTIYRVNKAKNMILETSDSIEEISLKCGFLNANTFIRAFKKYVGMTPTTFKKQ